MSPKSPWRRIAAAVFALCTLVAAAGCGGDAEKSDGSVQIRVAATGADSLPFMAVLQLAIDKGWFKSRGLDVSIYSGGGGGNTLRVVTSGDADLAITGSSSVVLASEKPAANLAVIGSWFQVNDFYWITPDEDAKLAGAKLGFSTAGSATELIVKALQAKRPDDKISAVSVGGMGDNWAAAKAGRITAGWAMHPFVTEKEQEEGARTLVATRDVIGDHPADLVAANKDFLKDNPDAMKKFFEGAEQAFEYVVDDTDKAAAELAPLVDVDEKVMAKALKDTPELAKAYSLKVDPVALKNLSDMMTQAGQIKEPVDWGTVLDQQYLPASARADL
ncbi:MAG: ABC transporter substrate-binding protein [Streptosporangiales bacterium]|nr:ABC transporter substrate-binding protein [Streptosporangiales bacterium]